MARAWVCAVVAYGAVFGVVERGVAADPVDAAALRALVSKLDLSEIEGPEGTTAGEHSATVLQLNIPLPIRKAYDSLAAQLTANGWKLLKDAGSPTVTDDYAQASFLREGCFLSLSMSADNEQKLVTSARLQNHGPFDTRKLPRPNGAKPLYESQFTTMVVSPAKVAAVVAAVRKEMLAAGWQEYGPADAAVAENPDNVMLDFRSGPVTVDAFIGVAPAQNGQTTIQYSTQLLSNELPWPRDVAKADFSDYGPKLEAQSKESLDKLVRWYNGEMKAIGWDANAGWMQIGDTTAQIAFTQFNTSPQRNLLLYLRAKDDGVEIEIEPISSEALVKLAQGDIEENNKPAEAEEMPAEAEEEEAPAQLLVRALPLPKDAEGVNYDAEDSEITFGSPTPIKDLVAFFRKQLVGETWKEDRRFSVVTEQAASFELEGPGEASLQFVMINTGLGDGTAVTISVDGMSFGRPEKPAAASEPSGDEPGADMPAEEPAPEAPADEELTAEDKDGFPIPSNYTQYGREGSQFRVVLTAATPAALNKVVAFYREHLPKAGWKEVEKDAQLGEESARLAFTGPEGPLGVRLTRANDETQIELETRSADKAKKAGLLPKPGQAKVVFGNPGKKAIKVTFGGKPFNMAAGLGTERPDGPSFDLAPGKYTIKVEVAGQPAITEKVEVAADEAWGVMIDSEFGVLSLRMY